MKIAVMGAGAVGCYYGAMLARAGHDVCMIGRPQHVAAMNTRGLVLETARFTEALNVRATVEPSGVAEAELVLFCVKSNDTMEAGNAIAPHLADHAIILSLQNGVDNAERLQALLKRLVVPVAVYVATDMPAAGHVRHHGRGELVIGPGPASIEIAACFEKAGVPAELSHKVVEALWTKLIINCAYNALSAIAQLPYGRMVEVNGVVETMRDIVGECLEVATRLGVSLPHDVLETVFGIAASMPNQLSSTAQDLARGKITEIDHLNGYVARKGREVGVPAPANQTLLAAIKLLENRLT
ncbi:MAG: 2-dehydropantoate 2-reductase [Methylobacteriaceae bacterium]|nr:2-dehydropantoate 2-reductase [Methylobacteriaceae bacterium]